MTGRRVCAGRFLSVAGGIQMLGWWGTWWSGWLSNGQSTTRSSPSEIRCCRFFMRR